MPQNYAVQWWSSSANLSSFIASTASGAGDYGISMSDSGTFIGNSTSQVATAGLEVVNSPSVVNYVTATGSVAGAGPTLGVAGSDANITLAIDSKGTGGVVIEGNQTGAAAPALAVGQYLSNSTTGTSMSNNVVANLTSENLGPGVWDVECTNELIPAGSTTVTAIVAGVNTTSATLGPLGTFGLLEASFNTGQVQYISSPVVRENLASTTPVYCLGEAAFGVSTLTGSAFIRATRVN